jgi:hypothetical protein
VHATLEVAVAGEDRGDRELVVADGFRNRSVERAGVADAGRAAIADDVESERLEIVQELRTLEILRDDLRAGRERGLDPGLNGDAEPARIAGHQARGEHDRRIRGVRAGRDGGDDDRAVLELIGGSTVLHPRGTR